MRRFEFPERFVLCFLLAACTTTSTPVPPGDAAEPAAGVAKGAEPAKELTRPAALAFVEERLVGTFTGEWTLFALDGHDKAQPAHSFTDVATGSNPRIEQGRAIVDVTVTMNMGGDAPPTQLDFVEGVIVRHGGERGDYFVDIGGHVQIYKEVKPDVWETQAPLTPRDYQVMANVTAENVIVGWKRSTKVVSSREGAERHDITVLTHVEYRNPEGEVVTAEFTSMAGYHLQTN